MAREFRWLTDYDLAVLFSPTGVASTVRLLSALFVSTDHYSLGSIDIGDAYLQVKQDEPTIAEGDKGGRLPCRLRHRSVVARQNQEIFESARL